MGVLLFCPLLVSAPSRRPAPRVCALLRVVRWVHGAAGHLGEVGEFGGLVRARPSCRYSAGVSSVWGRASCTSVLLAVLCSVAALLLGVWLSLGVGVVVTVARVLLAVGARADAAVLSRLLTWLPLRPKCGAMSSRRCRSVGAIGGGLNSLAMLNSLALLNGKVAVHLPRQMHSFFAFSFLPSLSC